MSKLENSIKNLYTNKKILILGMGKEGFSTLKFLRKMLPTQQISIMDISEQTQFIQDSDQHVSSFLGRERYLKNLSQFEVIFKTPSIPFNESSLQEYVLQGGIVTSQLNEFLRVYSTQTIGVTGTKGKSTTTAFIRHLLHLSGKNIVMAGNIGVPPFEIDELWTDESLVAMEMSSYQLETITFSPHWAIWLNVFAEHLNFHGTPDKYVIAKGNITLYQSANDYFIFNEESKEIEAFSLKSSAEKLPFKPFKNVSDAHSIIGQTTELKVADIFLKDDLPAILQLTEVFKVDKGILLKALETFEPLPHRLEKIETKAGIIFVDDTLATIPEATVAALNAFPEIKIIMLGGYDRGIQYELVVDEVVKKKVPKIVFFKPSGEKMNQILQTQYAEAERPDVYFAESMEEAVRYAYENAEKGDVVLLSPASPSFGQYKDYQDKAAQFRAWITQLDK